MYELEDLEYEAGRHFGAPSGGEILYSVDPERRARFEEWRDRRRAERATTAAKSVGSAWDEDLADGPNHTGFENERRKQKMKLSDDRRKSFKAMREACKALQSDANIGDECKALMSKIDGCLDGSEDGEKAAKSIGEKVNQAAAALADSGDIAGAIQAARMNPQGPSPSFAGK